MNEWILGINFIWTFHFCPEGCVLIFESCIYCAVLLLSSVFTFTAESQPHLACGCFIMALHFSFHIFLRSFFFFSHLFRPPSDQKHCSPGMFFPCLIQNPICLIKSWPIFSLFQPLENTQLQPPFTAHLSLFVLERLPQSHILLFSNSQ